MTFPHQYIQRISSPRAIKTILVALSIFALACVSWFWLAFHPVSAHDGKVIFRVEAGSSFSSVAGRLEFAGLIRSALALRIYAVLTGRDRDLQAGTYYLSPADSASKTLDSLVRGLSPIGVTLPEGATVYEVDAILSESGITESGAIVAMGLSEEGRLFPDTYQFLPGSSPEDVLRVIRQNFEAKMGKILSTSPDPARTLILASLLEREVPSLEDRKIVAGLIEKRISAGMRIQVDATVCYLKKVEAWLSGWRSYPFPSCYPLTALDLAANSPYNTYSNSGLPPGPIGSPGVSAAQAAMSPTASPYWFYLSDPKTKQTIFSRTFDEHKINRAKYLK